jgi:dTMP kinase
MARFSCFGEGLPELDLAELKGKLIVLEGTDGVGRSSHIGLLKQWLENHGHVEFYRARVQGLAPTGRWHHRR